MNTLALPSYQSLYIEARFNDQTLATGTAFLAATGGAEPRVLLITNRHIVTGRHQDSGAPLSSTGGLPNQLLVAHNGTPLGRRVELVEPLYIGETPRWIEHPGYGARVDVVGIPLSPITTPDVLAQLVPYDFSGPETRIALVPSDPVSIVGFPFGVRVAGLFPIWSTGFVASELSLNHNALPCFLVDCRSRPGQSGSPVIAYRGAYTGVSMEPESGLSLAFFDEPSCRLLGIYSGRISPESDLGTVWKASVIAEIFAGALGDIGRV